jgi:hypothetical protein
MNATSAHKKTCWTLTQIIDFKIRSFIRYKKRNFIMINIYNDKEFNQEGINLKTIHIYMHYIHTHRYIQNQS